MWVEGQRDSARWSRGTEPRGLPGGTGGRSSPGGPEGPSRRDPEQPQPAGGRGPAMRPRLRERLPQCPGEPGRGPAAPEAAARPIPGGARAALPAPGAQGERSRVPAAAPSAGPLRSRSMEAANGAVPEGAAEQPRGPAAAPSGRKEVKVVIVGDGGCGKTSLLMVYAKGSFPEVRGCHPRGAGGRSRGRPQRLGPASTASHNH